MCQSPPRTTFNSLFLITRSILTTFSRVGTVAGRSGAKVIASVSILTVFGVISSVITVPDSTAGQNLGTSTAAAQEIGILEEFALAEDRESVLKQLVPGTEEYYFFHCLHYQHTQQLSKVDELIEPWLKRYGYTDQVKKILNRQSLLKYSNNPTETLAYLQNELKLNFAHQREIPQTQRDLPTALSDDLLEPQRLLAAARSRYQNSDGFTDVGLRLLATTELTQLQRRHLLERLQYPDFPDLVGLIVSDLKEYDREVFGNLAIHQALTLKQLDELAKKVPALGEQSGYVNIYLRKLAPREDVNWLADTEAHHKYLERLWAFAKKLPPAHNSLKANILFRMLDLDRSQGKYDRELFMTYLKLPRPVAYINPVILKNLPAQDQLVNLNQDFDDQTRLPPINNDEPLVRDYLQEFLRDANSTAEFEPYVESVFLQQRFATVKILNGFGEVERWASILKPEQYQQLMDRVDLDFVATNSETFEPEDDVLLSLHTKNIKSLIVKIYEINTENYYRENLSEIDTNITLDGLVPNFERTFQYDESPALRIKREYKFPELKERGVYIVDFIAGGKSSRALIRKGRLQITNRTMAAGQLFTVLDSTGTIVADASLWISGRRYVADEAGRILVPFSTQPGPVNAIITQNGFSCLQNFTSVAERYELQSAMVVDRESLQRSNQAKILMRPMLRIAGGESVPLSLLKQPQLVITSVNLDDISSTKTISNLKLSDSAETVCEFVVPPRLKSVTLNFSAKIENISRNETETLTASQSYTINEIDRTGFVQDVHLAPTESGYILEVRGKTGETRPKQPVHVSLKMMRFNDPVEVDLQSSEDGQIQLGKLENVQSITVNLLNGSSKTWPLVTAGLTYPQTINSETNEVVSVPAPFDLKQLDRERVSLFEKRHGTYVADWFNAITLNAGLLQLKQLKAGDYLLRISASDQSEQHNIEIRVTAGKLVAHAFVGEYRILENRRRKPMTIRSLSSDADQLTIKLTNANSQTRVHVFSDRYQAPFNAFSSFAQIRDIEPWLYLPSIRKSVYMEGRKIGDEYQYILDRKYAAKFPGNMLTRPSLLLNPWATQETDNDSQIVAEGNEFDEAGNEADRDLSREPQGEIALNGTVDFANLDFLGSHSLLLSNLVPNEEGTITIDRKQLGDGQHLRIVALDAFSTVQRNLNLAIQLLEPRDTRLANALDPTNHFSQRKQIQILKTGDTLKIEDIVSAKLQYYDDLTDVYRLLSTLNPNANLTTFEFILTWNEQVDEKKRELYSKHACHELNFWLLKKDPDFFHSVVAKHLANKRDKTFLDQWLLDENLDAYVDPWKYARLNTVERILLAQRLETQSADIVRNVSEMYLLSPTSRVRFDVLYDTSIRGLGLDLNDQMALLGERRKDFGLLPPLAAAATNGAVDRNISVDDIRNSQRRLGSAQLFRRDRPSADLALGFEMKMDKSVADAPAGGGMGGSMGGFDDSVSAGNHNRQFGEQSFSGSLEKKEPQELLERLSDSARKSKRESESLEAAEGRTRLVPVTRMRTEERSITLSDGTITTETITVPYTVMVDQNYSADGAELGDLYFSPEDMRDLREKSRSLYRRLPPTQQWMEDNYYHLLPEHQTSDLVTVNRFWRDYAHHDGKEFLSPYFPEAHRTFTEMMFVLAVLDLPLKSPEQKLDYNENQLIFTAAGPTIAFHQQVESAIVEQGNTTILVSENFFAADDRYRFEEEVRFDKFISDEFHAHALYGGQVVITNPTSTPRAVELLIQIPAGSVATNGSQETKTTQMDLEAFSTKTFEYWFYFPTAGKFNHYPAHVSSDEKVLAIADSKGFVVTDQPAALDKTSWAFVSQNGSEDEVIEFLNQQNVLRLDLDKIAFRMSDEKFFLRTIKTLRNRYVYNQTLWSYSIKHNDRDSIREFLTQADAIAQNCGPYFQSELLDLNPVDRNWYQHREYWPLVNARVHKLGPQRKILNPSFYTQYQQLLAVLAHRGTLTHDDHLVVTYYMLLQDRIETALGQFEMTQADSLLCKIQYDYCDAYLDLYREKPDSAANKAEVWADYPVDQWRNRFKNILAQVAEIRGGKTTAVDQRDQAQQQTELAATSASFDFKVTAGEINVNTQNITDLIVNFYEMDIELLFSRSPFAQDELDGFSMIRPNATQSVGIELDDKNRGVTSLELPESLQNKNVLVEIVSGDQAKSEPYYAHSIDIQMMENYGQLQVADEANKQPIPKTYVKVYARMSDGSERFHKDGYTDLRGRFDYVSQSNHPLDGIEKFSVLILSDQHGAVIRQVSPPRE